MNPRNHSMHHWAADLGGAHKVLYLHASAHPATVRGFLPAAVEDGLTTQVNGPSVVAHDRDGPGAA